MLAALVLPEPALPCLDGHILQKVCISLCLRAPKAQLVKEGHHLHTQVLFLMLQDKVDACTFKEFLTAHMHLCIFWFCRTHILR